MLAWDSPWEDSIEGAEHVARKIFGSIRIKQEKLQSSTFERQPTTLWRCVPMLTLASVLDIQLCAPARVVADLVSRWALDGAGVRQTSPVWA